VAELLLNTFFYNKDGRICNSTEEISKESDLTEEKIKDWIIIFLKERREE
jgi:hypothetical protein